MRFLQRNGLAPGSAHALQRSSAPGIGAAIRQRLIEHTRRPRVSCPPSCGANQRRGKNGHAKELSGGRGDGHARVAVAISSAPTQPSASFVRYLRPAPTFLEDVAVAAAVVHRNRRRGTVGGTRGTSLAQRPVRSPRGTPGRRSVGGRGNVPRPRPAPVHGLPPSQTARPLRRVKGPPRQPREDDAREAMRTDDGSAPSRTGDRR